MAAAIALGERSRGRTAPNPHVGCLIVKEGAVVGRGWTQPGGRPHAEAMALAEAGAKAKGATVYVTLEPCAHQSTRGPACADLLVAARPARVVVALGDPDPRTLWAAAFRLREHRELRVLDLAYRPSVLAQIAQEHGVGMGGGRTDVQQLVADYAALWPLVIACSYRVLHREQPFIPEYVLPQLLTSCE